MQTRRSFALVLISGLIAVGAAIAAPATVSGKISEIDLHGRTMTVVDPKEGKISFDVPEGATIVLDGDDQAILDDVFEGDFVERATLRGEKGRLTLVRAVVKSKPRPKE